MKYALALALAFLIATAAHADTITDNLAAALTEDSSVPLSMSVADTLAANLLTAQADSSYAASEPDSLTLSFAAVLRAISLDPTLTLAYMQSDIAIDDRVSIAFSVDGVPLAPGQVLDFGSVMVGDSSSAFVVTPEPSVLMLTTFGLVVLAAVFILLKQIRDHIKRAADAIERLEDERD